MKDLPALPALADDDLWMLLDRVWACAHDPGQAESVHAAIDTRRLSLASILVMHRCGDPVGGTNAPQDCVHGLSGGVAHERIAQPCGRLIEADRVEVPGCPVDTLDGPGRVAGPITELQRGAVEAPLLSWGVTPRTFASCTTVGYRPSALPCNASVESNRPLIEANAALCEWKMRLQ